MPNPQIPTDLSTFTEGNLNEKLHFLCSVNRGEKGAFPSLEPWNICVLTIHLSNFVSTNYFPDRAELEWQIFQDEVEDSFYTHIPNIGFFDNYGTYPSLLVFEFHSYQGCYICWGVICTLSTPIVILWIKF